MIVAFSASAVLLFAGCERDRGQPWRKALDEGKVVRLGGSVGPLTPAANTASTPDFPPPVVVQPTPEGPKAIPKKAVIDDFPIPPPPKAVEKKAVAPEKDEGPSLGPPR